MNQSGTDLNVDDPARFASEAAVPADYAELSMSSVPAGARVFLNGDLFGVTPFETVRVVAGTYSVSAQLDGYQTIDTVITVRASHWVTLNLKDGTGVSQGDLLFAENQAEGADHILAGFPSGQQAVPVRQTDEEKTSSNVQEEETPRQVTEREPPARNQQTSSSNNENKAATNRRDRRQR